MAGPYVHCMVTKEALRNIFHDATFIRYRTITEPKEKNPFFPFVCLGSVSPDYPYPALKEIGINENKDSNGWTWGDKFHKQKTGDFIDIGIKELRADVAQGRSNSDAFWRKAAWLMGYYSHVITDLVVHAVVYKLVDGCYESRGDDHLHCEVVQDSMLFHDVYKNFQEELVDVKYLTILDRCTQGWGDVIREPMTARDIPLNTDIKGFWNNILGKNYPDFYTTESPKLDDWHSGYVILMRDAANVVVRHFSSETYQRTTNIPDGDKTRYYSAITLPDGTASASYRTTVFKMAVDEVTARLKVFLSAFDNADSYQTLRTSLKAWNLDKGTVDGSSPQFAMWHGQTESPFNCPGDPPPSV